jgi:NAD(P)-dependent dehydrogenase (short-subunit alcohol dehydrogenase family)
MKKISELQNLKDKVALVTGGAGYLGSAICETLAELGAIVIVASRDREKCEKYAIELGDKFGIISKGVSVDITNINDLELLRGYIETHFGKLDILVNDAWSGKKNSFDSITFDDWNYDINVCLNGPFYTTKTMVGLMGKGSKIINIASMYGIVAPDYNMYMGIDHVNPPSYGAAKAGVIQLTKYLASFLSPHGINVNVISPGTFPFEETLIKHPNFGDRLKEKTMLKRVGRPEDLKGVIALLCSDASNYINGQNISVDGGWTSW